MFLTFASFTVALAMDTPWDCPSPTSLEEMGAVEFADASGVWDAAWEAAYAWFDEACRMECADTGYCWEADCVTSAGATLVYRYEADTEYVESSVADEGTGTLTVRPPTGTESWSEIALTWSESGSSYDGGSSGRTEWTASWVGTLRAEWPADEAVAYDAAYSRDDTMDWSSASGHAAFVGTGCAWRRSQSEYTDAWDPRSYGHSATRTVNAAEGQVYWDACEATAAGAYRGRWNGAEVGVVDWDTWAPTGAADADADGFYAEDGDCDDADAAVNVCAVETWYDGVDADCDGADDSDQDGDGRRAESAGGDDCDDTTSRIRPGLHDEPCDGIDSDCDGEDPCPESDTAAPEDTDTVDTGPAPRPRERAAEGDGCAAGAGGGAVALLALIPLFARRRR